MQTHVDPVRVTLVSLSSYILYLVNSEGLLLLVSSIPSGSYNLSMSSSVGFPEIGGDRFDGDLQFIFSLHIMSGCRSWYLFPSAAR